MNYLLKREIRAFIQNIVSKISIRIFSIQIRYKVLCRIVNHLISLLYSLWCISVAVMSNNLAVQYSFYSTYPKALHHFRLPPSAIQLGPWGALMGWSEEPRGILRLHSTMVLSSYHIFHIYNIYIYIYIYIYLYIYAQVYINTYICIYI